MARAHDARFLTIPYPLIIIPFIHSKHCAARTQTANCGAMRRPGTATAIDIASGLLAGARYVASPNFDERPQNTAPDLIVIHGISLPPGEFGGPWIDRLFTNSLPPDAHPYFAEVAELKVSSHVLVRRDADVVQYVPFHLRAWHAGRSNYQGRERCNDFSIGLELEGTDDGAYEPAQYRALSETILALCDAYPSLSIERVVGHSDIAPGRKSDPGPAFDWPRLRAMLRAGASPISGQRTADSGQ
jgi:AmpD protein